MIYIEGGQSVQYNCAAICCQTYDSTIFRSCKNILIWLCLCDLLSLSDPQFDRFVILCQITGPYNNMTNASLQCVAYVRRLEIDLYRMYSQMYVENLQRNTNLIWYGCKLFSIILLEVANQCPMVTKRRTTTLMGGGITQRGGA